MSSELATRLVLSLQGLVLSTDCFSDGRKNSLDVIMLILQKVNRINSAEFSVNYLCFIHSDC